MIRCTLCKDLVWIMSAECKPSWWVWSQVFLLSLKSPFLRPKISDIYLIISFKGRAKRWCIFIIFKHILKTLRKQDRVGFMSQPYYVDVEIEAEVDLRLRLSWDWGRSLVELDFRFGWVAKQHLLSVFSSISTFNFDSIYWVLLDFWGLSWLSFK